MKIKKLLALACSVAMTMSIFSSMTFVAEAAGTPATATLSFRGYDYAGVATFAVFDIDATIPVTLSPYQFNEADWTTTFEDTYEGVMLQTAGFDIPFIDGLTFNAGKSSKADYLTIQNNTTDKKVSVYLSAPASYDQYYAGEIAHIATLYYLVDTTSDQAKLSAEYELKMEKASINLVEFADPSNPVPSPIAYTSNDPSMMVLVNDGVATAKPSVTLNNSSLTLDVDGTSTLTATVAPTGATVTWASDAEGVATVENGVVTAVSAGTANITATVGAVKATCVVTVNGTTPDPGPSPDPGPDPGPEPEAETYTALPSAVAGDFPGYTHFFKGTAITLTAQNINGKVVATKAGTEETRSTTKTVAELLDIDPASQASFVGSSVVPVLVLSSATGPAFTFEIVVE